MNETKEIYDKETLERTIREIKKMAERFNVTEADVLHAAWCIARDTVYARLTRDYKDALRKE